MQITVRREPANLLGKEIKINSEAPAARVYDTTANQLIIGMIAVKPQILIVLPSLKTEVCSYGAKKFNELLANKNVLAYMITTDDISVCAEFTDKNCISNAKILIDKDLDFGRKYGVLIESGYLKDKLARAVFVIDKEGVVKYSEIVSEVTDEANYESAVAAVDEVCKPPKKGAHHHENWMKV
jgi:thiol peroxidase